MPTDIIPTLKVRQAQFDNYEQFVSEAADAANPDGKSFIVGVKDNRVVAVNLADERGNVTTIIDRARRKPAAQAELDGGYERFLASIAASRHADKLDLVSSALARERQWSVPLRSRRILDVGDFLEREIPIPAFREDQYAAVFAWGASSSSTPVPAASRSTTRSLPSLDSEYLSSWTGEPAAPRQDPPCTNRAATIAVPEPSRGGNIHRPVARHTGNRTELLSSNLRDHVGWNYTRLASEVHRWAVPPGIDAEKLAAVWEAELPERLPLSSHAEAAQDAAAAGNDRRSIFRRSLHDCIRQITDGLRNRVDPRTALSQVYTQLRLHGAPVESAEVRATLNLTLDYKRLLAFLNPDLDRVVPDGYPYATPPKKPMAGLEHAPEQDPAAAAEKHPAVVEVVLGRVPSSAAAAHLAARWTQRGARELPACADAGLVVQRGKPVARTKDPAMRFDDPDQYIDRPVVHFRDSDEQLVDRLVREHFHDAVSAAAKHLKAGFDPRSHLLMFRTQVIGLSATADNAEYRALTCMYLEYREMLDGILPGLSTIHR